jgi:hypothetical protein
MSCSRVVDDRQHATGSDRYRISERKRMRVLPGDAGRSRSVNRSRLSRLREIGVFECVQMKSAT